MDDAALAAYGRHLAYMARSVEAALGDLSPTAYRVLTLVAQGDERSSQIAGRLAMGRPTVTYAVDTLVEKGLLARTTHETDRRVIRLELTDAGKAALATADSAVAARLRPVFERLDDPQAVFDAMADVQRALVASRADWMRTKTKPSPAAPKG